MGEAFLQLCQEVARLRELCSRQSELLQKLSARKGPIVGEQWGWGWGEIVLNCSFTAKSRSRLMGGISTFNLMLVRGLLPKRT